MFKKEEYKGQLRIRTIAREIIPYFLLVMKFEYDKPGVVCYSIYITPFFSLGFNIFKKEVTKKLQNDSSIDAQYNLTQAEIDGVDQRLDELEKNYNKNRSESERKEIISVIDGIRENNDGYIPLTRWKRFYNRVKQDRDLNVESSKS